MRSFQALIACLCFALPAFAVPSPKVAKATDGIFAAFQSHPLVGLGEWHGMAQELDFYSTLVRDPRFAREVGNVVLETGDAAQQAVVDRYVNGENVPYIELRKVWTDTVGWFPTVLPLGSINFYAAIRAINLRLLPQNRIKVWLGEPPIDWPQVKTKADWLPIEDQRDNHPVALIEREILGKGKKALVIYGADHFGVYPRGIVPFGPPELVARRPANIRAQLDERHPGSLYVVLPYVGYTTKACADRVEKHIKKIPVPSLISPIRGSSLEKDILRPGCAPLAIPPRMVARTIEAGRTKLCRPAQRCAALSGTAQIVDTKSERSRPLSRLGLSRGDRSEESPEDWHRGQCDTRPGRKSCFAQAVF
jgi:hypothetical protein